jgi:sugar-specific transcriptional regulator TrmB
MTELSQERVLKALVSLGLSHTDAEVYVFLATAGSQKARNIATALKVYRRKIYRSLKSLQSKEIVNATLERPAQFSAMPFEKALNLLIQAHLKEAKCIEQHREEILTQWHSISVRNSAG